MATTNSLTTTYSGEFAGRYISAALLSGKTLAEGNITIVPNVKFKQVMKKISTDAIVKDASCDFDPTSTLTINERILQPEEFQVNLQLCKKDFRSDWEAVQMGYSAYDNLPPNFSDFLIAHVADKVAQKMEQNIWNGTDSNQGEFAGFITTLGADADVVDVTGTTVDKDNVDVELQKIVDAIPSPVYGKEDLVIYVPSNVHRAYIRSLGGNRSQGAGAAGTDNKLTQWYNQGNALSFGGIELVLSPGLASDKMVAAEKSNLYFGTGLLNNQNEVKVIDMADIDGSQNVRIVMRFTAGIQHGIGSDIVLYA